MSFFITGQTKSTLENLEAETIDKAIFSGFMQEGMVVREKMVAKIAELGLTTNPEQDEFSKIQIEGKEMTMTQYVAVKKSRKKDDDIVELPAEQIPNMGDGVAPIEPADLSKQLAEKVAAAGKVEVIFGAVMPVTVQLSIKDDAGDTEVKLSGKHFTGDGEQKNEGDGTIRRKTKKALMNALLHTQTEAFKNMVGYLTRAGVTKSEDFEKMMDDKRPMSMRVSVNLERTKSSFAMPLIADAPADDAVVEVNETLKVRNPFEVTTSISLVEPHIVKYVYDNLEGGEGDTSEYEIIIVYKANPGQKWLMGGIKFF